MSTGLVVALAWMCHPAVGDEIPCHESRIVLDAKAYPKEVKVTCSRQEVGVMAEDPEAEQLRKEDQGGWKFMTDFAQAFMPENAIVDQLDAGIPGERGGWMHFAAAKPGTTLPEPDLRKGIEAIASLHLFSDKPTKVTWQGVSWSATMKCSFILCFTRARYSEADPANVWAMCVISMAPQRAIRSESLELIARSVSIPLMQRTRRRSCKH